MGGVGAVPRLFFRRSLGRQPAPLPALGALFCLVLVLVIRGVVLSRWPDALPASPASVVATALLGGAVIGLALRPPREEPDA